MPSLGRILTSFTRSNSLDPIVTCPNSSLSSRPIGPGADDPFARRCWAKPNRPRSDSASTTSSTATIDIELQTDYSPSTSLFLPTISRTPSLRREPSLNFRRESSFRDLLSRSPRGDTIKPTKPMILTSLPPELIGTIVHTVADSFPPGSARRKCLCSLSRVDSHLRRPAQTYLESTIFIESIQVAKATLTAYARPAFCPRVKIVEITCSLDDELIVDLLQPLADLDRLFIVLPPPISANHEPFITSTSVPAYTESLTRSGLPRIKTLELDGSGLSTESLPWLKSLLEITPLNLSITVNSNKPESESITRLLRLTASSVTFLALAMPKHPTIVTQLFWPRLKRLEWLGMDLIPGMTTWLLEYGTESICPQLQHLWCERCKIERSEINSVLDSEIAIESEWYQTRFREESTPTPETTSTPILVITSE